ALVAGPRLLVVPVLDDVPEALAVLGEVDGTRRVLDLLTREGLGATPPFVLIELGDPVRCVVRGEAVVSIEDAQGRRTIDTAGVSTWVERTLPGAAALSVVVPSAVAAATDVLPLALGAALVAEVLIAGASPEVPPGVRAGSASEPSPPPP